MENVVVCFHIFITKTLFPIVWKQLFFNTFYRLLLNVTSLGFRQRGYKQWSSFCAQFNKTVKCKIRFIDQNTCTRSNTNGKIL